MRHWDAGRVALEAGAKLLSGETSTGPDRVTIDSREVGPGALFVGLRGEHLDGGAFAAAAIAAGAWGVIVEPGSAGDLHVPGLGGPGTAPAVIVADSPLAALQSLARAWRRELGAQVIGVTGSTGKTSTKDLLAAMLAPHRVTLASRANFNTEIGLPLQILAAPSGTEVLVLEMAMRGSGQIAELAEIAEPDVGVIVSIGPVHLELLGSIEAIAAAKAELLAALPSTGTAILPARETLLEPHLRADLRTVTFGAGGDVTLISAEAGTVAVDLDGTELSFSVDLDHQPHLQLDLLAAAAAAAAVGVRPGGELDFSPGDGRGRHLRLPGEISLIDGSYNANPMSMRAALTELEVTAAERTPPARRVAVLGDMLELGPDAVQFHRALGERASGIVDVLITVGPLARAIGDACSAEQHHVEDAAAAAALLPSVLEAGDVVLVKGSYGVGLRAVVEATRAGSPA